MGSAILRKPEDVDMFIERLCKFKLPVTVSWVKGADRTDQQNHLQWLWASEVSYQLRDRAPEDEQARWKLEIGIPILRADDPAFRREYDELIRPMSYEDKIRLMKLGYPVSSRMKVRQMVRYLDSIERECREQGLDLTEPDPDLAKYHSRYREEAT